MVDHSTATSPGTTSFPCSCCKAQKTGRENDERRIFRPLLVWWHKTQQNWQRCHVHAVNDRDHVKQEDRWWMKRPRDTTALIVYSLSDLISAKQNDILAKTETWLSSCDTSACLSDISHLAFPYFTAPPSGRGGGMALLITYVKHSRSKISIHPNSWPSEQFASLSNMHLSLAISYVFIVLPDV